MPTRSRTRRRTKRQPTKTRQRGVVVASAGPSLPAQAGAEGRSPRLSNVALDGYAEVADPAKQQRALEEFKALAGDTPALWRDLVWNDRDASRLRREREAFWEHRRATSDERELRDRLASLRRLRADPKALEALSIDPASVQAQEEKITSVLHRVTSEAAHSDPRTLAQQRRSAAKGTPRERLHHQIAFGALRVSTIQHYFIPEVIRTVYYAHVSQVRPAVEQREHERFRAKYGGDPGDRAERWRLKSEVLATLYRLTADLVQAFYPVWARHVTPRLVRFTIENTRKPRRAAR